jgi:hypothetical protein
MMVITTTMAIVLIMGRLVGVMKIAQLSMMADVKFTNQLKSILNQKKRKNNQIKERLDGK